MRPYHAAAMNSRAASDEAHARRLGGHDAVEIAAIELPRVTAAHRVRSRRPRWASRRAGGAAPWRRQRVRQAGAAVLQRHQSRRRAARRVAGVALMCRPAAPPRAARAVAWARASTLASVPVGMTIARSFDARREPLLERRDRHTAAIGVALDAGLVGGRASRCAVSRGLSRPLSARLSGGRAVDGGHHRTPPTQPSMMKCASSRRCSHSCRDAREIRRTQGRTGTGRCRQWRITAWRWNRLTSRICAARLIALR